MITFLDLESQLLSIARQEKACLLLKNAKKEQLHQKERHIQTPEDAIKNREGDVITDIVLAEDGSLRTKFSKHSEFVMGYADGETVWLTAIYKRIFHIFIRNFKDLSLWGKIMTVLSVKYYWKIMPEWFEHIFSMNNALLKDEYWLPCVKEIRRLLTRKMDTNVIDAISAVVEYDAAYRYRLQDIIVLYDKDKSIVKNVDKMLKTLIEREVLPHSKEKWRKWILPIKVFSFLYRKQIKEVLDSMSIEKVKLNKNDTYFICQFNIYNCHGWDYEQKKKYIKENYGRDLS